MRIPENWEWGKIHTIAFTHAICSVKIFGSLFILNSGKYGIGGIKGFSK